MGISLEIILATVTLSIGSFMNVLDSTIVNVSLSHIAGDFAVAPTQGTWVITSYAVSEAIFLPLIGWLTKKFGIVFSDSGSFHRFFYECFGQHHCKCFSFTYCRRFCCCSHSRDMGNHI